MKCHAPFSCPVLMLSLTALQLLTYPSLVSGNSKFKRLLVARRPFPRYDGENPAPVTSFVSTPLWSTTNSSSPTVLAPGMGPEVPSPSCTGRIIFTDEVPEISYKTITVPTTITVADEEPTPAGTTITPPVPCFVFRCSDICQAAKLAKVSIVTVTAIVPTLTTKKISVQPPGLVNPPTYTSLSSVSENRFVHTSSQDDLQTSSQSPNFPTSHGLSDLPSDPSYSGEAPNTPTASRALDTASLVDSTLPGGSSPILQETSSPPPSTLAPNAPTPAKGTLPGDSSLTLEGTSGTPTTAFAPVAPDPTNGLSPGEQGLTSKGVASLRTSIFTPDAPAPGAPTQATSSLTGGNILPHKEGSSSPAIILTPGASAPTASPLPGQPDLMPNHRSSNPTDTLGLHPSNIAGISVNVIGPSAVIFGSQTITLSMPTTIISNGHTFTINPSEIIGPSTTLLLPAPGPRTTGEIAGIPIDVLGSSALIFGSQTLALGTPTTIISNGQTFTINPSEIIGPSTTFSLPSPKTTGDIDGIPIGILGPSAIIFGSQTITISTPTAIVSNGRTFTINPSEIIGPSTTFSLPAPKTTGDIAGIPVGILGPSTIIFGSQTMIINSPTTIASNGVTFTINPSEIIGPSTTLSLPGPSNLSLTSTLRTIPTSEGSPSITTTSQPPTSQVNSVESLGSKQLPTLILVAVATVLISEVISML